MNTMRRSIISLLSLTLLLIGVAGTTFAAEPSISEYTSYPASMVNTVKPNIMLILDNSGSMNINAYGSAGPWAGETVRGNFIDTENLSYIGWIVKEPFVGEPYNTIEVRVSKDYDDAQERKSDGSTNYSTYDLDLGRDSNSSFPNQIIGLRFKHVQIPQGATVTNAYIEFNTHDIYSGTQSTLGLTIFGEDTNDAKRFEETNGNISSRPKTSASVTWDVGDWNTVGEKHHTPDLTAIVQEIVDRKGWRNGNPMAFTITNQVDNPASGRVATACDVSPSNAPLLHIEIERADATKYYGYFNPDYFYFYNTNKFDHKYKKVEYVGDPSAGGYWRVEDLNGNLLDLHDSAIVSEGLWDGNWLNWLSMRRIDVLRKVLMGGLATARTGGGDQVNKGESSTRYTFIKRFDSSNASAVSPYDGDHYYAIHGDRIYVVDGNTPSLYLELSKIVQGQASSSIDKFNIHVQKRVEYEPESFHYYDTGHNLAGVLQKLKDQVRWGNEFFNFGTGSNESGGYIHHTIGTNVVSLVTDLENTHSDTWTPLAESYYVAIQYFEQMDVQSGLDYPNTAVPNASLGDDPYCDGGEFVYCAKSFVILLTDGMSTMDKMIPDEYKDFDGDGSDPGDFDCHGSDYLDDLALYARTTDLRSSTVGKTDLEGDQNLILYTIYAFGDEDEARQLLKDAAKNGGFDDRNGNRIPDGDYNDPPANRVEWDKDGDANPDTYYEASNGYKLEKALLDAVTDILKRAASGTAVSVLTSSLEGEGNLVQAYYRPSVAQGLNEVKWVGYLQSLWVDPYGNLREDTDGDLALDVQVDKVVAYFSDPASGDTKIKRFDVSAADPYPDQSSATYELMALNEIYPLWEAGSRLAQRDPAQRKIFTFIDKDEDALVDETTNDPFDYNGEVVSFHTDCSSCNTANCIGPYLGLRDDSTWSYLGTTHDERVTNLINYVRGTEVSGLRSRTIDGNVWKLGDIIHSTPVSISRPPDNYHILYTDESYQAYYNAFHDRETVVYVGANDGMLHAFTSWKYDSNNKQYVKPSDALNSENVGDEIWAYIPHSLLPHLKWLPSPAYTHVYYVDLKPKVFDAKILPDETHYSDPDTDDNWGTFLLLGLNMGGKHIEVQDDFNYDGSVGNTETRDFYPSYACLDITDPRDPRLLWERTYRDLEMSMSVPAIIKVKDKWFAVFGSGPSDYDGTSNKRGHVFVIDLKTGAPYGAGTNDWLFETSESDAFMNSPVSLDKDLNFSVDSIYLGATYYATNSWRGKLYKIAIPWVDANGDYDGQDPSHYSDNPLDGTNPWQFIALFDATRPVTASVSLSKDAFDNVWIYGGTGRHFSTEDKTNDETQYIFGIKDPFYNIEHTPTGLHADNYYLNYGSSVELQMSDLLDADAYAVTDAREVFESGTSTGYWNDLLYLVDAKDGWVRSLTTQKERVLTKPSILGGIVFTPSYVPNDDVCGYGGESYLYGFYYETGTAYFKPVFEDGIDTVEIQGQNRQQVLDKTYLGSGKASSLGLHMGMEEGATGFVQQSTGSIQNEDLTPAFKVKSGLRSWIEKK